MRLQIRCSTLGFVAAAGAAGLHACAPQPAPRTLEPRAGAVERAVPAPVPKPGALVFRFDPAALRAYRSFILDPAEVYVGTDTDFAGASDAQRLAIASFLRAEFARQLRDAYPIVTEPGPGTARLKLWLAGLDASAPARAGASDPVPPGLARQLGADAPGPPVVTGAITYAGEIRDSVSNRVIAVFAQRRSANPLNARAMLSTMDAYQAAATDAAEGFRAKLDEIQQQ